MEKQLSKHHKLARNTIILYVRTFVIMLINLYISRLILSELGVSDYGVYNIVGGVVIMMSLFTNNMSSTTQRFISFELAKNDLHSSQKVFSTAIVIHFILGLIVFIIAEIVGVWFIEYKLNIPSSRLFAAQVVYQCSLISFIITLLSVPYNASIISHERMNIFAYISILESILKLIAVLSLSLFHFDKLIIYGVLLLLIAIIIRLLYGIYCSRNFKECKFIIVREKKKYKTMTNFAGWSFIGTSANILNDEGMNILINLFFGVTLNAARGIAVQIQHAIMNFVNSFMISINPQITKSYSLNNTSEYNKLILAGSRYSFFLYLIIAIPIYVEADNLLILWLKEVPNYTVIFLKLTLCVTAFNPLSNALIIGVLATGKIKKYYLILGLLNLSCLPMAYFFLHWGTKPESIYYILIVMNFILLIARPFILRQNTSFPCIEYLLQTLKVSIISISIVILCSQLAMKFDNVFIQLIINSIISICTTIFVIFLIGLKRTERNYIITKIKNIHI